MTDINIEQTATARGAGRLTASDLRAVLAQVPDNATVVVTHTTADQRDQRDSGSWSITAKWVPPTTGKLPQFPHHPPGYRGRGIDEQAVEHATVIQPLVVESVVDAVQGVAFTNDQLLAMVDAVIAQARAGRQTLELAAALQQRVSEMRS